LKSLQSADSQFHAWVQRQRTFCHQSFDLHDQVIVAKDRKTTEHSDIWISYSHKRQYVHKQRSFLPTNACLSSSWL